MSQDIFRKVEEAKERRHEKIGEQLRDRIRHEARDTLKIIGRLRSRGITDRKIMGDIERSQQKGQ